MHFSRLREDKIGFKVVEFTSADRELLTQSAQLRAAVWNTQVGFRICEEGIWSDSHDEHACHWGVWSGEGQLIASARLCIHDDVRCYPDYGDIGKLFAENPPPPIGMLNRLVVHPQFQKKGIARLLDRLRIQRALEMHCNCILIDVPHYRTASLKALGFEYVGTADDQSQIREANIKFYLYALLLKAGMKWKV